jgi:hypothetical protein
VLNFVAACHSYSCDMYTTSGAVSRYNVAHSPISSCVTVYIRLLCVQLLDALDPTLLTVSANLSQRLVPPAFGYTPGTPGLEML